jgi:hypothetical protein
MPHMVMCKPLVRLASTHDVRDPVRTLSILLKSLRTVAGGLAGCFPTTETLTGNGGRLRRARQRSGKTRSHPTSAGVREIATKIHRS